MLAGALQAEVAAYVEQFVDQVDGNGRRLVVRNGYHHEREVLTAAGAVTVTAPRVNDKRANGRRITDCATAQTRIAVSKSETRQL
jgi:putative transposase